MGELTFNTRGASAAVEVTVVSGLDAALDAAAAAADPRHAFLRRAWFAAARPSAAATIVARRPDGRILAALPVASGGPAWLPMKAVPGCYWPLRSFPVAADGGAAEIAAILRDRQALRALGPVWRLGPVLTDDPTARRLIGAAAAGGWRMLQRPVGASFVLEAGSMHRLGLWPRASTLKKNRWFEKQLAETGPIEVRFVSGGQWCGEVFDTLAEIESASWIPKKTAGGDAKFLAPHHRRFWEAAAADPALASMMKAAIMTLGGRPAAFSFEIECGDTRYAVANSYDEAFAKFSPGRVLAYRSLIPAVEAGLERIDWGCGDSGYKRTMGAVEGSPLVDLLFVRNPVLAAALARLWRG